MMKEQQDFGHRYLGRDGYGEGWGKSMGEASPGRWRLCIGSGTFYSVSLKLVRQSWRDLMSAPKLLSGGNHQIPKGEGDGPVQAYIAAMPGWKSAVGKADRPAHNRSRSDVRKAISGTCWRGRRRLVPGISLLRSIHQGNVLQGASLVPLPPVGSRQDGVQYVHLHEDEQFDAALLKGWILQAVQLPGQVFVRLAVTHPIDSRMAGLNSRWLWLVPGAPICELSIIC